VIPALTENVSLLRQCAQASSRLWGRRKSVEEVNRAQHFTKCSLICRNNIFSEKRKNKERKHLGILVAGQEETLEEQAGQTAQLRPCAPRRHSKARRSGPLPPGRLAGLQTQDPQQILVSWLPNFKLSRIYIFQGNLAKETKYLFLVLL